MESNSSNPQTPTGDAQQDTGGSSSSAWSDNREPGQASQSGQSGESSQTGGGAGASMRKAADDADNLARRAADAAQGYLQDAKAKASAAVQTGKAYAQDAVNAAGEKIDSMKGQAADLKQRGMQFAADEPMKAVAYAAIGSAVLTAVLILLMRERR